MNYGFQQWENDLQFGFHQLVPCFMMLTMMVNDIGNRQTNQCVYVGMHVYIYTHSMRTPLIPIDTKGGQEIHEEWFVPK